MTLLYEYLISLSDLYLGEDFQRNNAFSLYDLYGQALANEPTTLGVMKCTILIDPSLVIITIIYLV